VVVSTVTTVSTVTPGFSLLELNTSISSLTVSSLALTPHNVSTYILYTALPNSLPNFHTISCPISLPISLLISRLVSRLCRPCRPCRLNFLLTTLKTVSIMAFPIARACGKHNTMQLLKKYLAAWFFFLGLSIQLLPNCMSNRVTNLIC
jgi:hypothetical protein